MYKLELTEREMSDIHFVGYRYSWSDTLDRHCIAGLNEIPEHVAWEIRDAFDADTEGGHSMFPMLDSRSELADKLYAFYDSIV